MTDDWPPVVMGIVTDPVEIARSAAALAQCERNWDWLEAHASDVYSHRGKYICIAGQQLFVGDVLEDVLARAKAAHPDDRGLFTRYIPKERMPRIYANRGIVEAM
ncbi:MAG TPA: hypothetical protein VKA46_09965 [Gemmataceae bacterium]|nr:hypothetical protein [Gemmataceae bacterium]